MRGLAACLAGLLALGALGAMAATMSACSDSTDASGGAGGATAAGGSNSGGKSSSGGTSSTGGGSGVTCSFISSECNTCLVGKCKTPLGACTDDSGCADALTTLTMCVCNPSKDPDTCIAEFVTDQGDLGMNLAECYTLNSCDAVCQ